MLTLRNCFYFLVNFLPTELISSGRQVGGRFSEILSRWGRGCLQRYMSFALCLVSFSALCQAGACPLVITRVEKCGICQGKFLEFTP